MILGVVLLAAGGLQLATALGYRLPGGVLPSEVLWPAVLVAAGLWLLTGRRTRASSTSEAVAIPLSGATEAAVRLEHGAGTLRVSAGSRGADLVRGKCFGGVKTRLDRQDSRLAVVMRPNREWWDFLISHSASRLDWDLKFNPDVPISLVVRTGANAAYVDLRELRVTELRLEAGASQMHVVLPAAGRVLVSISVGASALEVLIPRGVAARIKISGGASLVDVDRRFPRIGGIYRSTGFDSAADAVDVEILAGAAEVRVV